MTVSLSKPTQLGKYEIIEELGRGGFGVVYRALNPDLQHEVALKVIHPQLLVEPRFVEHFFREARIAARLGEAHPNIVTIHDIAQSEGRFFIVMQLLEGQPLDKWIASRQQRTLQEALPILEQVADALDFAHNQHVLHRDVKSSNVIVRPDGHATLTDFGLARAYSDSGISSGEQQAGTLRYMAPEQFDASLGEIGPATDVYALGIVAYEMLAGHPPFEGNTTQIMHGHLMRDPPRLGDVPGGVQEVLDRALAKQPGQRFGSGGGLVAALREGVAPVPSKGVEPEVPGAQPLLSKVAAVTVAGPVATTSEPKAGTTRLIERAGITLVHVPGGEFWMGSADDDGEALDSEKPRHKVQLDGFWIARTEVTNAQYRRFIEDGGYTTREYWTDEGWRWKASAKAPVYWDDDKWNPPGYPVVGVSWYEAAAFARWAGARLPTEAEWEYAARGGPLSKGYRYAGSNDPKEVAWYDGNSGERTHPAGQKRPNELGLCDMSGNVFEWCQDWYEEKYYGWSVANNPAGPPAGDRRLLRGGSWSYNVRYVRCAYRLYYLPGYRSHFVGFRVAE